MKGFKKGKKFVPTDKKQKVVKIDEITKVEGLNMDNPKQAQFVTLAKNRLEADSRQLKDLKKVVLQEHRRGEARAEKRPMDDGKYEIIARYTPSDDPKEINGIMKHEIDHIWYAEEEQKDPAKLQKFIMAVADEGAFTKDLEDLQKKIMSGKGDEELLRRYFDEYHSEIGQVNERIKLGLLSKEEVEKRVNLDKVTQAYNELHS